MAAIDDARSILETIFNAFKQTDETGSTRGVLRNYMPTPSTEPCLDDFPKSVESLEISHAVAKSFAPKRQPSMLKQMAQSQSRHESRRNSVATVVMQASVQDAPVVQKGFTESVQSVNRMSVTSNRRTSLSTVRSPASSKSRSPASSTASRTSHDGTKRTSHATIAAIRATATKASNNPFAAEFAQFAGAGLPRHKKKTIKMWYPFCTNTELPIDMDIVSKASIRQVMGYALYEYMEQEHRQPRIKTTVAAFQLRVSEDDGSPDMDLPAFAERDIIAKFSFDSLCLCLLPGHSALGGSGSTAGDKSYFRISASTGVTILPRDKDIVTVQDMLRKVVKKRGLLYGEYLLERKDAKGVALDLTTTVDELEDLGVNELQLINIHSKRQDMDDRDDTIISAQVAQWLALNQRKTYFLTKRSKIKTMPVELIVDPSGISISTATRTATILTKTNKKTFIRLDRLVKCERDVKRSNAVRIVFQDTEISFKSSLYEAADEDTANDLLDNIRLLLQDAVSEQRDALVTRYELENAQEHNASTSIEADD
eukprot:TRINITY_DN7215_c2_g1_i2.p1 TRINITY_DN7215_c2_g1~~TRINITY_DN7215_c2_g1_i2.p1  ORF type:complete len:540 (+),score=128.14 TRINITY_DN7215_c2_g1_i2:78-1697(+)